MEMRKCEVCGEMYSTTYRTCPFCEEEEAMRRGKPMHRHASDFRNKRGGNALGVLALVLALIVVGGGVWAFFGDSIASLAGIRETSGTEGNSVDSGDSVEPLALVLDQTTLTLQAGTTGSLSVTGGGESRTWSSDNTAVAEVNENGLITAVAAGEAVISVTDGTNTAQCTVQVTDGEITGNETTGGETTGGETTGGETTATGGETTGGETSGAALTLNREDFTLPVGQKWQLKVSGTSSTVTWSIADTSIATIASDGTVTGVSKGVTTATAKVDGQTLECIVRIS